jgi:predicted amidohydrolase
MGGSMVGGREGTKRDSRLRVALGQVAPALGDLPGNVAMHLRVARAALRRGARLLVFPELSLTGYRLQDLVVDIAVRLDDPAPIRPLLEISRRISLIVGLVEESEAHRFYNSALFLEGGRIRHVHRKVYLPTYGMFEEGRYFSAGESLRAFRSRLGRLGMAVCEDVWHPPAALLLAQDGADYLFVLANGPTHGIDRRGEPRSQQTWDDLLKVTAQLQTVFVVCANRAGCEDGVTFGGGSSVHDPSGRLLARGKSFDEDLVICDLERAALRRARAACPLLRDERLPLVSREILRLIASPSPGRGAGAP